MQKKPKLRPITAKGKVPTELFKKHILILGTALKF